MIIIYLQILSLVKSIRILANMEDSIGHVRKKTEVSELSPLRSYFKVSTQTNCKHVLLGKKQKVNKF